jgi:small subunit ribosomal protein S17
MDTPQMANETKQDSRRAGRPALAGTVSSVGGHKTIHVIVSNLVKHPIYGKFISRRTKLAVHDPENVAVLGDVVEIVPCRRMSKSKSWRLLRIVRQKDDPAALAAKEE